MIDVGGSLHYSHHYGACWERARKRGSLMARTAAARWAYVYDNLRLRILTLELAPGASLTESLVAKELDVSPTPVRDALGRLCQDGLVEVVNGRGYRVAPLTVPDIAEICDLRFALES